MVHYFLDTQYAPIFVSCKLLCKKGQDFVDIQYYKYMTPSKRGVANSDVDCAN